jgi:hypothetical protein
MGIHTKIFELFGRSTFVSRESDVKSEPSDLDRVDQVFSQYSKDISMVSQHILKILDKEVYDCITNKSHVSEIVNENRREFQLMIMHRLQPIIMEIEPNVKLIDSWTITKNFVLGSTVKQWNSSHEQQYKLRLQYNNYNNSYSLYVVILRKNIRK